MGISGHMLAKSSPNLAQSRFSSLTMSTSGLVSSVIAGALLYIGRPPAIFRGTLIKGRIEVQLDHQSTVRFSVVGWPTLACPLLAAGV